MRMAGWCGVVSWVRLGLGLLGRLLGCSDYRTGTSTV